MGSKIEYTDIPDGAWKAAIDSGELTDTIIGELQVHGTKGVRGYIEQKMEGGEIHYVPAKSREDDYSDLDYIYGKGEGTD